MSFVVNLWGAPGSGKSTMAAGLFYHLKKMGLNAEIPVEYAKELVWDNCSHLLKDQMKILGEQRRRVNRLAANCDIVVSDSPLLMASVYYPELFPDSFRETLLWAHNEHRSLNILITRKHAYQGVGRVQTEAQSDALQDDIRGILENHDPAYFEVDGSDEGLASALEVIVHFHNEQVN